MAVPTTKGVTSPRPSLPSVSELILDPIVKRSLQELSAAIVRELEKKVSKDQPTNQLMLMSPGGKIYQVVVSDAGALSTTLLYSPT